MARAGEKDESTYFQFKYWLQQDEHVDDVVATDDDNDDDSGDEVVVDDGKQVHVIITLRYIHMPIGQMFNEWQIMFFHM